MYFPIELESTCANPGILPKSAHNGGGCPKRSSTLAVRPLDAQPPPPVPTARASTHHSTTQRLILLHPRYFSCLPPSRHEGLESSPRRINPANGEHGCCEGSLEVRPFPLPLNVACLHPESLVTLQDLFRPVFPCCAATAVFLTMGSRIRQARLPWKPGSQLASHGTCSCVIGFHRDPPPPRAQILLWISLWQAARSAMAFLHLE